MADQKAVDQKKLESVRASIKKHGVSKIVVHSTEWVPAGKMYVMLSSDKKQLDILVTPQQYEEVKYLEEA